MSRRGMGARYPGKQYRHQYGDLLVTVESRHGSYMATVRRPSDGYEITIETPERTPRDAAGYALQSIANRDSSNPALRRAAEEIGLEARESLAEMAETAELSGVRKKNGETSPLLKRWVEGTPNEELWARVREYRKDPLFIEHLKTGARKGFVDATSLVPLFIPDDLEWLIPELKELPHPWWREEDKSDEMIERAFSEIEAYVNHEKPSDIPGWFAFEYDPAEGVKSLHYLERM